MTDVVTVDVTAEDIANGISFVSCACPLALAVQRATGAGLVTVGDGVWIYSRPHNTPIAKACLSDDAKVFMWEFDCGRHVEPFSFQMRMEKVTR